MSLALFLPLPPPAEALFLDVPGRGHVKTHEHRVWQAKAMEALWQQKSTIGFPVFAGCVSLALELPSYAAGDEQDRSRAVMGFLHEPAGMIPDGDCAVSVAVRRVSTIPTGMCRVTVSDKPLAVAEAA